MELLIGWFSEFTAEAWIAFFAAVVALVALFFTGIAAKAARDQTKIQRQLRIDAAQPYVWVDIREDNASASMLNFEIGNSGNTVATNVRVTVSSPLPSSNAQIEERLRELEERMKCGLQSLAPGRIIRWPLGVGHQILAKAGEQSFTFTIHADGPFGAVDPLTYTVSLDDWRLMRDSPHGSLHMVRKSIDSLTKQLEKSLSFEPTRFGAY
ncbi:hypothetical protein ACFVVC_18990 [Pseudarthrobacter sp. NPDC058196]|uniref:hypothetical protein n=1 Tax=Pseudarthrobacter sp. NPDC058196 TaxID=3346376 RepID=UPI0036DB2023